MRRPGRQQTWERGESFGFLGFDFRYLRSLRGVMRPHYTLKKRTALLRELKGVFRRYRSQSVERVINLIAHTRRHSDECGGIHEVKTKQPRYPRTTG